MLKEQLLGFAMKAISQAHETKERIKTNLKSKTIESYMQGLKDAATCLIESRFKKFAKTKDAKKSPVKNPEAKTKTAQKLQKIAKPIKTKPLAKKDEKIRKSSIKPAKEISSKNADTVLQSIKKEKFALIKQNDMIDGKKSLAYLIWALGHAERANMTKGMSVHDVTALLYRASKIELYPINLSRVIFKSQNLVQQASQEKRTKTYLLTLNGKSLFERKFL